MFGANHGCVEVSDLICISCGILWLQIDLCDIIRDGILVDLYSRSIGGLKSPLSISADRSSTLRLQLCFWTSQGALGLLLKVLVRRAVGIDTFE